jgi:hypothetical protein
LQTTILKNIDNPARTMQNATPHCKQTACPLIKSLTAAGNQFRALTVSAHVLATLYKRRPVCNVAIRRYVTPRGETAAARSVSSFGGSPVEISRAQHLTLSTSHAFHSPRRPNLTRSKLRAARFVLGSLRCRARTTLVPLSLVASSANQAVKRQSAKNHTWRSGPQGPASL